jgi:hypothetical protein
MQHRFRELSAAVRRALGRPEPEAFQLELAGPVVIRRSGPDDEAALERLAALDSRMLLEGSFLLVVVDGELVPRRRSTSAPSL